MFRKFQGFASSKYRRPSFPSFLRIEILGKRLRMAANPCGEIAGKWNRRKSNFQNAVRSAVHFHSPRMSDISPKQTKLDFLTGRGHLFFFNFEPPANFYSNDHPIASRQRKKVIDISLDCSEVTLPPHVPHFLPCVQYTLFAFPFCFYFSKTN